VTGCPCSPAACRADPQSVTLCTTIRPRADKITAVKYGHAISGARRSRRADVVFWSGTPLSVSCRPRSPFRRRTARRSCIGAGATWAATPVPADDGTRGVLSR